MMDDGNAVLTALPTTHTHSSGMIIIHGMESGPADLFSPSYVG
jgi:hypothetical protein